MLGAEGDGDLSFWQPEAGDEEEFELEQAGLRAVPGAELPPGTGGYDVEVPNVFVDEATRASRICS